MRTAARPDELVRPTSASSARSRRARWVAAGVVVALALGLWLIERRTSETGSRVGTVRTALRSVADAYAIQSVQLATMRFTDVQLFERVVESVAERERITPAALRAEIGRFVASVNADADAGEMDRALAAFGERRFVVSAELARRAAVAARARWEAVKGPEARAGGRARAARADERDARGLEGQALLVSGRHAAASAAFRAALERTPRAEDERAWAALQSSLGAAESYAAKRAVGDEIARRHSSSITAHRLALEVYTRKALPQDWARTQANLATALHAQAASSQGTERRRLLSDAVAAHGLALEVYTREALPHDWARTQNHRANALRDLAAASQGTERARLLSDAVAAHGLALEVYTREALPHGWARTQSLLALALGDEAAASEGTERVRLLAAAAAAYRLALEVYTRETLPRGWARTQNHLAIALRDQAAASEGTERARLLSDAVTAFRLALEVRTRGGLPHEWAATQQDLAVTLRELARHQGAREGVATLREAADAMRAKVEASPSSASDVAAGNAWIAKVEAEIAKRADERESVPAGPK